jgi:hypothetical protein
MKESDSFARYYNVFKLTYTILLLAGLVHDNSSAFTFDQRRAIFCSRFSLRTYSFEKRFAKIYFTAYLSHGYPILHHLQSQFHSQLMDL